MGREIKVTVAMPAYNASKFIRDAIESVLSQDDDSFELLIADDASSDDTGEITRSYRKDPRVRFLTHKKNRGVGRTRNKLVRLAKGKYITPCDADDIMLAGNLKRLSGVLDQNPRIGAVYGDVWAIEEDRSAPPRVTGKDYRKVWDLLNNAINHPGSMIRKSLILKVGGYDEKSYSMDDWGLWLKLAEVTRFKYLRGEIYYVYRRHPKSLTRTDKRVVQDAERLRNEAIRRRYGF